MGRTAWGDVVRNARTLSRLIWFHVPLRLTPKTADEISSGKVNRPVSELNKVMAEKRMAMDLIEGRVLFDQAHRLILKELIQVCFFRQTPPSRLLSFLAKFPSLIRSDRGNWDLL